MPLHVKVNLQTTLVNEETNPDFFNGDDDKGLTLEAMQKMVGGYIQQIRLAKPVVVGDIRYVVLICNEEGKLSGLPFNAIATRIAKLDNSIMIGDVIVGDAILLTAQEAG